MPKGYVIFHVNLGFSSIDEKLRSNVISDCYHPLLDLIERSGVPVGVELNAWTLKKIEKIDPNWIVRFKSLLKNEKCELIGSGYSQIIGPLVPYQVNEWNHKLGLEEYKRILGVRPNIVLVNEMAYSNSLIELYKKFEYKGIIMERNNVSLALEISDMPISEMPTHAQGNCGEILPIIWSDSILFQKLQQYAHGDISIEDYLSLIQNCINNGEEIFPIYSNDAEIFDFRPGRFSEEKKINSKGEWNRLNNLLNILKDQVGMEWVSPSEVLIINKKLYPSKISKLTSTSYPIPVKKQAKYNIARWAITGRNDLWLNTMCFRIANYFLDSKIDNSSDWLELCELWASDLRTHITEKRWKKTKEKLDALADKHKINNLNNKFINQVRYESLESSLGNFGKINISIEKENTLLVISTPKLKIGLNLRRGLTINNLAFLSHNMKKCLGTIPHGFFTNINNGADYYSGGVIVELPVERKRITDLEAVKPEFLLKKNGDIEVHSRILTPMGKISKSILIPASQEKISIGYSFENWTRPVGSIRLGIVTLFPEMFNQNSTISCSNGGEENESFKFEGSISHNKASSTLVSSSAGFGATSGEIIINNQNNNIRLGWSPSDCAVFPMLENKQLNPSALSRIYFSLLESDDTSKISKKLIPAFKLDISTLAYE